MAHRGQQDKEWANQSTLDSLEADRREAMLRPGDLNLLQKIAERSDAEWTKIGQRDGLPNDLVLRNADHAKGELFGRIILTQLEKGDKAGAQRTWEFSQQHVDPQTITDAMRNKMLPGQEQQYREINPTFGENADMRPEDVQLRSPGGQQFVQAQMPGTASDAPMLPSGSQLAQNPPSKIAEKSQRGVAETPVDPKRMKNVPRDGQADNANPHRVNPNGYQVPKPAADPNDSKPSGEGQSQQKEVVDSKANEEQLDSLVARGISGRLGNGKYNIGNMDRNNPPDGWEGMGDANGRFEQPNAPDFGVRMNTINMRRYAEELNKGSDFLKPNKNLRRAMVNGLPLFPDPSLPFTLRNIGLAWAPSGDADNDPLVWSQNIAKISQLGIDQVLDPKDEATMVKLLKAMNKQEHGSQTVSDEDIVRGVRMGLNYKTNRNLPISEKTVEKRRQEIRDNVLNGIDNLYLTREQTKKFKDRANKKLDDEFRKIDSARKK